MAAGEGGGLVLLELLELAVGGLSAGARDGAGVGSGTEYSDELPLVVLFAVVVRLQRFVFVFRGDADDSSAGYGWSLRAEGGGLTRLGPSLTATSLTATSRTAGLLDPRNARASTSLAACLLAAAPLLTKSGLSKSGLLASTLWIRSRLAKTGLLTTSRLLAESRLLPKTGRLTKSGLLTNRLWAETRLLTGSGLLPPSLLVVLSRLSNAQGKSEARLLTESGLLATSPLFVSLAKATLLPAATASAGLPRTSLLTTASALGWASLPKSRLTDYRCPTGSSLEERRIVDLLLIERRAVYAPVRIDREQPESLSRDGVGILASQETDSVGFEQGLQAGGIDSKAALVLLDRPHVFLSTKDQFLFEFALDLHLVGRRRSGHHD